VDSIYNLGMTYSVNGEFGQAIEYLSDAISLGHKKAVIELSMIYVMKGENERAIVMLKNEAKRNNEIAMAELGDFYNVSDSAYFWYKMAAENNSEKGIFKMGLAYEMGCISVVDMDSALFWYDKLAKMGDCITRVKIAKFYIEGKGFDVNVNKGIETLELITEDCHRDACYELGKIYEEGIKVEKNIKKAKEYYNKSYKYGGLRSKHELEKLE